ncbi:TIGR02302 family protein [uncultured Enterovirga sp.]|uniref:TIGR02302 family protein n=1 Tax=uncultured Enterovirga sp. TaxID=2026352 RepID=UPI0035C9771C
MAAAPAPGGPAGREGELRRRLSDLVRRARATLVWEQVWPALWGPLGIVLLFLVGSWLGLWLDLPALGRMIGVALFAVALILSLLPALRVRIPRRNQALDRVDRDSAAGHRPARTLEDTMALGAGDPGARALWALHLRRAEASIRSLTVAAPRPGMAGRDRFAVRAIGIVAAAAAAFVAGPEIGSRIGAAFDWRGVSAPVAAFRIDGWIDPPLYTRLPPLMIDLAAGEQRLRAPVGSTLVVRMAGRGEATLTPGPGLSPVATPAANTTTAGPAPGGSIPDLREQRYKLTGSTELVISSGIVARAGLSNGMRLVIEAIPDRVPEIVLSGAPETNARGTFTVAYKAKDDYGLTSATVRIERRDSTQGRRSLVAPPTVALQLPGDHRAGEEAKTTADLTEHPWAGARVRVMLAARDEADQEGTSAAFDFTLPQRPFTKPLAKALVEQRRNIILDPDNRRPVQTALDALLIAPEQFTPEWGIFLGLRAAADRYRTARSDEDLSGVAEWLWAMALQIEEGDLSDAERELRAAQERLREAMERGAGEKEIAQLTDELRRAMDRFLREFAEQMKRDGQSAERQPNGPERTITQNDLNRMIQEMQDAMKRGDMAEAQRLLDQLKNVLENLRMARPNSRMSDPMSREMGRQMEELDEMVREQQQLRDETYREGQQQRSQQGRRPGQGQQGQRGQRGQRGEQGQQGQQGQGGEGQEQAESGEGGQGQQGGQGLGRRQQALRERLEQMQRRMRGMGMQGEQGFGDAEGAMRDAEGQLGRGGREGEAVDSQGRALEGLQRGMQGMAQQMQRMMGQNDGDDQGGEPGGPGNPQGRASNDPRSDDPLGRPTRSRDFSDGRVRIPSASESAVERARRILEELRRKLGDPTRPREELDYFERLLRRN